MSKIVVSNLVKKYNKKPILNNISFTCDNEILFIAGCNGAGKTTFLRIAMGLEKANEGNVRFYNEYNKEDKKTGISAVFDTTTLFTELSGIANIKILCTGYLNDKKYLDRVLKELAINDNLLNKKVAKYSFGQKHRLCVAIAIIRKPKFLFLDEPTIGLDPLSWKLVRNTLIMNKEEQHGCIILTGQDYEAMSDFADKIIVLSDANIKYFGEIKDFISLYNKEYTIKTDVNELPSELGRYSVKTIAEDNHYVYILNTNLQNSDIFELFSKYNIRIIDFKEENVDLQKAFLKSIQ